MKKILMLLLLVVLLTGCSANVNLTITSTGIEEDIVVTAYSDSVTSKSQVYSSFRKYMPVFADVPLSDTEPDTKKSGIEYYTRKEQELGSGYKFSYNYIYKFDDYKNARSVKYAFDSKTIQRNTIDKNIMISTDSGGLNFFEQYSDLESVTINIKTSYKVLENNADYVNGSTYTWVLRKGTKKGIYILLNDPNASITNNNNNVDEEKQNNQIINISEDEEVENEVVKFANDNPILIALFGIIVFLIVLFILTKFSKTKY